jgi:hypothetical protein
MTNPLLSEPSKSFADAHEAMAYEEAVDFFSVIFHGKHHIHGDVKPFGRGWKVNAYSGHFATFDFDNLTRLVFLCHDRCVRAEIVQGGPGRIGIAIWKRHGRNSPIYDSHPTIKTALINWRTKHPEPTDGARENGHER